MTWAPQETQKTIYALLLADATLTSLIGANRIFDFVSDNQAYPFIKISADKDTWEDRGSSTTEGWTVTLHIDLWYRSDTARGKKTVQDIQNRIDVLLHKSEPCIEGWNIIAFRRQLSTIVTEPDNVTLHGIQVFNLLLGEVF